MKLGYVGLPCQMEGLRSIDLLSKEINQSWSKKVSITVGLFCRENWAYSCFKALIEDEFNFKFEDISKFDIKKGNIVGLQGKVTKLALPLKSSKDYVRTGCMVCMDFSCELVDLAVGAVGSPPKWSTVIVRTKAGAELLKSAEEGGYLEVNPIENVKPGTMLVKKLSKSKLDEALMDEESKKADGITVPHINSADKTLENIKDEADGKGFKELNSEIIETGLCSSCGTCSTACPEGYITMIDETPTLSEECNEECNLCYLVCPRVALPTKLIKKEIFKNGQTYEEGLGDFLEIVAVRAKDGEILEKGQDGGAVTALMKCALDNNILDGVVSVKEGDNLWEPIPTLSKSKEDLIKAIGTYYAYASTIQLVKKGDTN